MEKRGSKVKSLPKSCKVVVIGAGIAGLTAAATLIHNGIRDVVLLEAQDYVGGRIKTTIVDGKPLDMGAMFIHGEIGNPVYEIVKTVGTFIEDGHQSDLINRPQVFYTSKREKVLFREVEKLIDFMEESLKDLDEDDLEESVSRGDLMVDFYKQFLKQHEEPIDLEKKKLFDAAYQWFLFYEKINEGADDLGNVSALAGEEYLDFKGNHFARIKGGYSVLLKSLNDLIPDGVIYTDKPVAHIDWRKTEDSCIRVRCKNGEIIRTDHVISTMSIGCLKAVHTSMFDPSLPSPLMKAVNNLELGAVGKIFLRWDSPFWNTDLLSYEFLWLDNHDINLKQDQSKRMTKLGKLWWNDIPGLETVSDHPNLLLIWLLPHQTEVVETMDDQEIKNILHELIQHFFYDVAVPEPSSIYKTSWLGNEYIRGGYCYSKCSTKPSDAKYLSKPIPSSLEPCLLFAGEGYSLKYMTTTHGALITGDQQAAKVLAANGINGSINIVDIVKAKQ